MHLGNENLVPAPFCGFSSGFVFTALELRLCKWHCDYTHWKCSDVRIGCKLSQQCTVSAEESEDNEVQVEHWRKLSSNSFVQFSGSVSVE